MVLIGAFERRPDSIFFSQVVCLWQVSCITTWVAIWISETSILKGTWMMKRPWSGLGTMARQRLRSLFGNVYEQALVLKTKFKQETLITSPIIMSL